MKEKKTQIAKKADSFFLSGILRCLYLTVMIFKHVVIIVLRYISHVYKIGNDCAGTDIQHRIRVYQSMFPSFVGVERKIIPLVHFFRLAILMACVSNVVAAYSGKSIATLISSILMSGVVLTCSWLLATYICFLMRWKAMYSFSEFLRAARNDLMVWLRG